MGALKMNVVHKIYPTGEVSYLQVYQVERSEKTRLHIFKSDQEGNLVYGSYYEQGKNITGLDSQSTLFGMFSINDSLYLLLNNQTNSTSYLQECAAFPVNDKIVCKASSILVSTY